MLNGFDFKFRIQRDGKKAKLYKGPYKYIVIKWSNKDKRFRLRYSQPLYQAELERNFLFCSFINELLTYMEAYKQDADKLQALHDAFQRIINK